VSLRASLWQDDLSQIQFKSVVSVSSDAPVRQAIAVMRDAGVGYVLIVDQEQLRGIFTERDLVKRVLAKRADLDAPISQHMTANPVSVRRSESIGGAIRTMHRGHYRHLPVVDDAGRPIGILSVKHIVHYLVEHFPSAVYNLPPEPGKVHEAREGA